MTIEKICEYLSEIGILEYENINIFLDIFTKLNNTKISDKIIDTLAIYISNNYIKNNQLQKLSKSIISSFNNYQLILKYRILNNMKNILYSKIQTKYIIFFLNLSFYLLKKKNNSSKINLSNKKKKSVKKLIKKKENNPDDNNDENKYNEENTELISSDDERECTFTPKINKNFKGYKKGKNNIESKVYYSPAFNISSKFPINNYQNNIQNNNNNFYNINDNSYTDNNYSNYSNYNNYNISNETRSNRSYNILDNNQMFNNDYLLNEYNSNYYINNNNSFNNNSFYSSNNSRLLQSNINNYNLMNNQNSLMRNYPNIQNSNIYNYNRSNEFFNKELEHIQRVKDKIQNMKIEKLNKIKEECTFEPKINTNYKSFYNQNKDLENNYINKRNIYQEQLQQVEPNSQYQKSYKNIPSNMNNINNQKIIKLKKKEPLEIIQENNNLNQNSLIIKKKKDNKKRSYSEKKKGIKIIEDLSLARKRRTDKTKRLMKERNFTPKIRKSDKYKDKVTMSFQDRVLKSIELKNKYKKGKNNDNNNKIKNEEILSPGEMVRYIDKNDNDINNDNNRKEDDELYKKVNNTEYNNNENINKGNKKESDNYSFSNDAINKKEIEKNKMLIMNRIKDEHKIGFKVRKDDDDDIKEKEDIKDMNNNIEEMELNKNEIKDDNMLKLEEYTENKNSKFSLNSNEFHSKALKSILEKNKNEN